VPGSYDARVQSPRIQRRLAAFAAVVIVGHHTGTVLSPLGEVGSTRWADWADLVVPYAVAGTAAATLAAANAGRRDWTLLAASCLLYTQGHGIHLAANSIANVQPSDAVHLWDETVGHWLWYSGFAVIVATLAHALAAVPSPRSIWSLVFALAFGLTVFTNSVEGGTAPLGLATGVVFVAWGLRSRQRAPELLVPAYAVTLLCLAGWGAYWRGFPQFSELGWI
jgi:hypothetical protein